MHRRLLLTATLALAIAQTARAETADPDSDSAPAEAPHINVSVQQMRTALGQRFPLRYPVAGLANLDVQTPRLRLLPEQNRVAAEFDVQAAGPALERQHQGTLELDFALRYEASDRSLRAHKLRLRRLQFPTLQPGVVALLNGYAPGLAERSLLEVVLHQLQPKDLALADTLGLQPGGIRVTEAGLRIDLVTKPL
jgi:hypothetical protein